MPPVPTSAPLDEGELDILERFLAQAGGKILSLEMLDGFFGALIAGPELVLPSRYLPHVIGDADDPEAPGFASMEEAQAILSLLTRHWNDLAGTLATGGLWSLVVADEEADHPGHEWAFGFLLGIDLTRDAWLPWLNDDERAGPIVPIFMLAYEDHPDPTLRSPAISPELREDLLLRITAGLTVMHRDFREPAPTKPLPPRRGKAPRRKKRKR